MKIMALLLLYMVSIGGNAETVSWTAPTQRTDGSAITVDDIKYYLINVYDGATATGAPDLSLSVSGSSTSTQLLSLDSYVIGPTATFEMLVIGAHGLTSTSTTTQYAMP
jgi:hypothetical protein